MEIIYPFPWMQFWKLILAALTGRFLSFHEFATKCVCQLNPPLELQGSENLPVQGGYVILVNHYYRPGFPAWWIALSIASAIPREMHWVMAAAWTYPDKPYGKFLENISRFLFRKAASVFDFTNMPPMPPRPSEVKERAQAVRKILRRVHDNPHIILGLAPEGGDNLDGKMHLPPPGLGRFIAHLQAGGLRLVPAGVYETGHLCLRFGAPFQIDIPSHLSSDELDESISKQVYAAIAALLPENIILEQLLL